MSERDLLQSVEQARVQLTLLRSRLERHETAPGLPEIRNVMGGLLEILEKLQTQYGLVRGILDRTTEVVFAKGRDGRYAMINPKGAGILGKSMAEVLGADDRALFEHRDAQRIMAVDREVMRTGEPQTHELTSDIRGIRTTLLTTTTAWHDGEGNVRGVIGIAQVVADHKRDEREVTIHRDRMRSMAAMIVIGEERLRRSLAAELHTGLGQDIALAKMKLSKLRSSASADLHDPLGGIEQLVERADQSLRSVTFQISPPSLHDLGLVAALQWLGEDIGKKYGIDVRIEDDDSPGVADETIRVILFRAVRELLVNAATHAQTSEVEVRLTRQNGFVHIAVTDAGAGFDAAELDRRGYGLFGIREQLKYVDGSMEIASVPGSGTTVTLTAPAAEPVGRETG